MSYADMLKELKTKASLHKVGSVVGKIRKTRNGNRLIELWKDSKLEEDPGLQRHLLEEIMAAYNLVVANQPGVNTYEEKIARSVLDLIFSTQEVTKNISFWKVLDAASLSDHRYISTKLLGKQNQRRKYKTKGGWSLQSMNREKFLQRISAANLEGSATTEEVAEALMRAIADVYDASMPRRSRPTTGLPQTTSLLVERGVGRSEK